MGLIYRAKEEWFPSKVDHMLAHYDHASLLAVGTKLMLGCELEWSTCPSCTPTLMDLSR